MSSAYYTSLSGMMAANYGLQNTSNNIANMQSPGFKRSDVFYSSLGNNGGRDSLGSGVMIGGQSTNFAAGKYIETGNPSDLAIVGNGFFIIKMKSGELCYTRDGEFGFNQQGILIDKHSGGQVQGYNHQGALVSISQFGPKTNAGKPTHFVNLKGEWLIVPLETDANTPADPDPFKSKFEPVKFSVANIYDSQGKAHTVQLTFNAPGTPGTGKNPFESLKWELSSVTCDDATITFDPQSIEFDSDNNGMPLNNNHTIRFTLNGNQNVTLNFGESMSDKESSVRLYKKNSADHVATTVDTISHDGYGIGKQIAFSFDDNGQIFYQYDNGQSETGIHIALAKFIDMEHALVQKGDNLFHATNTVGMTIGRPNQAGFGTIQPQKIEESNVDSTMEFSNIVVLQRMFQACAQIMDIDKQLLEELYKK